MSRNPHKNPNPQGKGAVAVLADWESMRPRVADHSTPATLLMSWFVSTLVLSARFRFRPVVGGRYYLYLGNDGWKLSLIGPDEWRSHTPGGFLGSCSLRPDMTWNIEPCAEGLRNPEIRAQLGELVEDFSESLDAATPVSELLPGYRRELPYYQRMLATALGRSLKTAAERMSMLDAPGQLLLEDAGSAVQRLAQHAQTPETPSREPGASAPG